MSINIIQTSFSAGELSPALFARVDLAKYHVGAALMRNFFVDYRGGASTRVGLRFVAQAKISAAAVRVIPFQFSVFQTYVLEFGDYYMRVYMDGAPVLESAKTITAITQAQPGIITATNDFANGDTVFLATIAGMTQLNQVTGLVQNVSGATFSLTYLNGNAVDTGAFSAYTSGGIASRVFTLATPYAAADLGLLKFTQSADVLTLTHPSYAPRDLTRTSHYAWTLSAISFAASIAAPASPTATASAVGVAVYAYVVTAVGTDGQESVASARADVNTAVNIGVTAGYISVSWTAVTGAAYYNVYKAAYLPTAGTIPVGVNFGWIGDATGTGFEDNNIIPDFAITPPLAANPFASSNNPAAVAYFQQRQVFAGSTTYPESMWMSQSGAYKNFDSSNPIRPNDSITVTLVSKQVNNIKYMVAMPGGLVVLTGGNSWQVSGGSPTVGVTPLNITATPQVYNGVADVEPIVVIDHILYVQSKGTVVRDLAYNFEKNIYTGQNISIYSNHLLQNYTIREWAFAEEPFNVAWTVRSDGKLLSLTYLKEQEVIGWAQHDTFGLFQSVTTIQEGDENAVYFVVKRLVQGQWLQYIERMASRSFPYGVEDAWCVDCGLSNTLTYPAAGVQSSAADGPAVFLADAPVFTSADIGKVIRLGGGIATITGLNGAMALTGTFTRPMTELFVDGADLPVPIVAGDWSLTSPITEINGLSHLEGMTVSILGDGNVFPTQVVTDGAITLSQPCTKVIVGLGFSAQLQTLYLDIGEPTIQGKRKKIAALTMRVSETRGLKAGPFFDELTEYKQRTDEPMGQPIALETGDERLIIDPAWTVPGQICIQQDYPLPATVLGVIPEIALGDTDTRLKR